MVNMKEGGVINTWLALYPLGFDRVKKLLKLSLAILMYTWGCPIHDILVLEIAGPNKKASE